MSERPTFDPFRVKPPPPAFAGPPTLTPGQLNELVRGALTRHVPSTVHVFGEVSDLSRPTSGHLYFSLKDPNSEIRCVMWRSAAVRLKFAIENGMEAIATGGVEVYTPRGLVQLVVRRLEPRGIGALELAFRQLRERLEREGLFDPRRKRPLPPMPERVAVVTSPSGAALRDIVQTMRRRFPATEIIVFPVRVQGDGAAVEIAHALRSASALAEDLGVELVIVGRGGGSLEDLWAFNEEVVARAIAACRVPVVSAVGHEVDISISDLVADVRAATPTAAAEIVTPQAADLGEHVERQRGRALRGLRHGLDRAAQWLAVAVAREPMARPAARLLREQQRIDDLARRARTSLIERTRAERARLARGELTIARVAAGALLARAGQQLAGRRFAMAQALRRRLYDATRSLEAGAARARRAVRLESLARYDERLKATAARLSARLRQRIGERDAALLSRLSTLKACDPKRVLLRGYSLTRDARTRRVIRSIREVRDGQRLIHEVSDGEFGSTAEDPRQPRLF